MHATDKYKVIEAGLLYQKPIYGRWVSSIVVRIELHPCIVGIVMGITVERQSLLLYFQQNASVNAENLLTTFIRIFTLYADNLQTCFFFFDISISRMFCANWNKGKIVKLQWALDMYSSQITNRWSRSGWMSLRKTLSRNYTTHTQCMYVCIHFSDVQREPKHTVSCVCVWWLSSFFKTFTALLDLS